MKLLHYLEIQNFKSFGDTQRIALDHPTVLIGPNNCGKTTAIQAIALWSHAVKTWYDNKGQAPPKQRAATPLNRLNVVAVPVQRTRYFWHNATVRRANQNVPLVITLGVLHNDQVEPVTMRFRHYGDEVLYCTPDEHTQAKPELIRAAAQLDVELLYPMSGLETEEPILQPGRVDVLLGQGQTAQVLRNLCLIVHKSASDDWDRIVSLVKRLFAVEFGNPEETARGSIDLLYRQDGVKEPLDISLAGRGLQQMLLIFAYLYSHRRSVLLIDEPDAHLEILRQKQVYVLLREIAAENGSQVILVTHSEIILDEALDHNLTLLLEGRKDDLAARSDIRNALQHYGTESYVRARQCGYVLYVEGGTDVQILRAFARHMGHPVFEALGQSLNSYYLRDNFPDTDVDSEMARVEGSFGMTPQKHFVALRSVVPGLEGLAILDSDGTDKRDFAGGGLQVTYWKRYEIENYFVAPDILKRYSVNAHRSATLFGQFEQQIDDILDGLIVQQIFAGNERDFGTWKALDGDAARLVWDRSTERTKLSSFAEEFFRRLAEQVGGPMLLRKSDLHELLTFVDVRQLPSEVSEKLDRLNAVLTVRHDTTSI